MDFEVLSTEHGQRTIFHEIADFFKNRRRQLQDWESTPPHRLGWFILVFVSLELVLSWRLSNQKGLGRDLVSQTLSVGMLLLLLEMALAKVGQEVGEFFKKKGSFFTTITFFNISLLPLLLVLPLTLLNWTLPQFSLMVVVVMLFLISKVFANFRESLEISFEFSRLQSALVLYLSSGLITVGIFLALYISFFGFIGEALSSL